MLEETATESRQATDNESNEEAQSQNGEVIISTDCILYHFNFNQFQSRSEFFPALFSLRHC